MVDINALKNEFFVQLGDVVQASSFPGFPDITTTAATTPQTEGGCKTTYLVDGSNYFGQLKSDIANLINVETPGRFFYTNSWWLGTSKMPTGALAPFELQDGLSPNRPFEEDIRKMVEKKVDVRILAWASPLLLNSFWAGFFQEGLKNINLHTLRSAVDLRKLPGMSGKVVLNTLSHTFGGMHLKMVVCGDDIGFHGYATGLDFVQNRNGSPTHPPFGAGWHDVAIKVEGTGANGLYQFFRQLWNEQVRRTASRFKAFGEDVLSHTGNTILKDQTPLVGERTTPPLTTGNKQHVQILRTVPTMKFFAGDSVRVPFLASFVFTRSELTSAPITFAPNGIFEFRAAQRKAINAAQNYIYIEDQSFSNYEVAEWINARLHAVPGLKVILLHMPDPADEPTSYLSYFKAKLQNGVAAPANRIVFAGAPYIVHSKLTIIDDKWAVVGTSNCMRRSFYMDGEISVSVLDEDATSFAQNLRKDLWGEHCGKIPGSDCDPLLSMPNALGIWNTAWGTPPAGFSLKNIVKVTIPFPNPGPGPSNDFERDQDDGDSRLQY